MTFRKFANYCEIHVWNTKDW